MNLSRLNLWASLYSTAGVLLPRLEERDLMIDEKSRIETILASAEVSTKPKI